MNLPYIEGIAQKFFVICFFVLKIISKNGIKNNLLRINIVINKNE